MMRLKRWWRNRMRSRARQADGWVKKDLTPYEISRLKESVKRLREKGL